MSHSSAAAAVSRPNVDRRALRSGDRPSAYAALPYAARRAGSNRWAVYEQYSGAVHWLDDVSAAVLSLCQGGRSLDEHLLCAAATCRSVDIGVVSATLGELRARGLLYRVSRPEGRAASASPADTPTVGIVTADRPQALRRCLRQVARHCRQFGRIPEIIVVDGSREERHRASNRQFVRRWRSQADAPCRYVGDREVRDLRRALAARGVDSDLVDFALCGGTGANRNVLVLLTLGRTLVMLDDDVICEPWTPAEADSRLVLGSHDDHHDHTFYESRRLATSDLSKSDIDVCRAHSRLLGRSLGELVEDRGASVDVRDACCHLLRWVHGGEDARIRLTFAGLAGDSGVWCPYSMLFGSSPALRRLLADQSCFSTGLSSRELRRVVRSDTVTDRPWCMAYCMGLDNRVLVPPFMPSGRNQDGVFGVMMKGLDASSLSAHLPFGVVHDSSRASRYPPAIQWASSTRLCDFILAALQGQHYQATSREAGLDHFGRMLMRIGRAAAPEFLSFTMHAALDERCEALTAAEAGRDDVPPFWRAAIDRCRETLTQRAATPEFFLASDLETVGSTEMKRSSLQGFIERYGRLTSTWPEIVAAARTLGIHAVAS